MMDMGRNLRPRYNTAPTQDVLAVRLNAAGQREASLDDSLKALGVAAGRPWRKEQKLACLAAWVAVAAQR